MELLVLVNLLVLMELLVFSKIVGFNRIVGFELLVVTELLVFIVFNRIVGFQFFGFVGRASHRWSRGAMQYMRHSHGRRFAQSTPWIINFFHALKEATSNQCFF